MDACTHQAMPNPELAPPAPAPAPPVVAAAPQEATGDSESDVSAPTVGDRRPSVAAAYAEDDAESCSGAGGVDNNRVPAASVEDDDAGRGADDVAVEVDENEVDSRMCVPWWRRTVQDAATSAGGGCARPQAAAEGGRRLLRPGPAMAESNRLFWEACIAHGY